jgi:hypothetical protein
MGESWVVMSTRCHTVNIDLSVLPFLFLPLTHTHTHTHTHTNLEIITYKAPMILKLIFFFWEL